MKTRKLYCTSGKNFVCSKIKNLSNFLINLNGLDFPKLTSIKVCDSNSKIPKRANLVLLKNINNRRLIFNGIEIKIFMNSKVNYVITTWSGPRREPNLSYLKNHLINLWQLIKN